VANQAKCQRPLEENFECGCTKQALSGVAMTTSASISFSASLKISADIVCL
jgi:hypothetical protein